MGGLFRKSKQRPNIRKSGVPTDNVEKRINAMSAMMRKILERQAELQNRVSAIQRDVNRIDRRAYPRQSDKTPIDVE